MKLWLDDVRPAPEGYVWCKSVNEAKSVIESSEDEACNCYANAVRELNHCHQTGFFEWVNTGSELLCELIDADHDLGDYACDGGDGVKLLDWLEETSRNYSIHIHSQNPVGVQNMRRIIERNGWKEVL